MPLQTVEIESLYDNPLKRAGKESEHDALEAEHFDAEAERFLSQEGERALFVDLDEAMPPRHRAFWREIGEVRGLSVLDVGSGYGYSAVRLAMSGAEVAAIDISPKMCELTLRAAELNGVRVEAFVKSASKTGFPDEAFDLIVGQVSLHHLSLESAGPELARILKPGGRAIFLEPIQAGRLFLKLRSYLPIACKESPGGGALRIDEIERLGEVFGSLEIRRFGILERLRRIKAFDAISPVLYAFDGALVKLPGINRLAAHALIVLTKTKNHQEDHGKIR